MLCNLGIWIDRLERLVRLELKKFPEFVQAAEPPVPRLLHAEYLNCAEDFRDVIGPEGAC
jgi:hypothetical protein